mmetsp:Transcript_3254/g.11381  ORF Transcript_3254/g.11381 Transcript_3254/m.11381 type:complete len:221 (-) Transcript_3254:2768-3430(-)
MRPQLLERDVSDVDVVDEDCTALQLHEAEHRGQQAALARARPAADADLLVRLDLHADVVERRREVGPVAQHRVLELDPALAGPARVEVLVADDHHLALSLDVAVEEHALCAVHVLLHLCSAAHQPRHPARGREGVAQRQTGEAGVDAAVDHHHEGGQEDDRRRDRLEADVQPAVGRDHREVGALVVVELVLVHRDEPLAHAVRPDRREARERLREVGEDG